MRGKKLILEATETGCIIPTSHKLNQDGYFRNIQCVVLSRLLVD